MTRFTHLTADLHGVPAPVLRDPATLGGLCIAAAGAAGLSAAAAPLVRHRGAGGGSAFLLLETDGCHLSAHAIPEEGLVLVDVLVPETRSADTALEVFVRRLGAATVERQLRTRGDGPPATR
jgi:S-adenosylmethionine/arginine decarboxylase-like enzyme